MKTLQKTVYVDARSADEAESIVRSGYDDAEYVLDADNFVGVEFDLKDKETILSTKKQTDRAEL